MQAVPPVNASVKNDFCVFYNYTIKEGFCKDIITSLYVYGNDGTLSYGEFQTKNFGSFFEIFEIADKCRPIIRDLFCWYHFPPCEMSLEKPRARKICRRSCDYLDQDLCKKEMTEIKKAAASGSFFFDRDLINCSLYDVADGGNSPECYQYYPLSGKFMSTEVHNLRSLHLFC